MSGMRDTVGSVLSNFFEFQMGLQIPYGLYPPKAHPEVSLSSMMGFLKERSTFEVARRFGGQELNFAMEPLLLGIRGRHGLVWVRAGSSIHLLPRGGG